MAVKEASAVRPSARERLLAAANELFYNEGVHTVGIDRVIEQAGVAKASLYNTFGSKDELVRAYLETRHASVAQRITQAVERYDTPRERLLAVFEGQGELFAQPDYRGCAFARASAESHPGDLVEQAAEAYRRWVRALLTELADRAGVPEPEVLARQLHLLYDGSGQSARMDHDPAAAASARAAAATLLDAALAPERRPGGRSGVQAGYRFRGGSEGGIAGCRVPTLAGLDELDLVRVQAAHGRQGEVTAWRAGRVRLGYRFGGRVQRGVLGVHLGQRGGAVRGRDVGGEDLDGHRAGDAVQVEDVGPGQVAAGAAGRGPHDRHPEVSGGRQRADRLPFAVAGRPVTQRPGQLTAPRRRVGRVDGPHGMGGPDGAVEQRRAQRGHQPRHPRRDHSRPAVVVNGLREVADPLREPVVVAERLPPLEPDRHHRVNRCPACSGEPARPAVDVVGAVEHGQRLAGHGSVVDKAVRQLEAGRRHPLERLVQSWRRVTHLVLPAAAAHEPLGAIGSRKRFPA